MDSAELDALKQIRIERRLKQLSFRRELDALKQIKSINIESDDYKDETAHFWIDSDPQRARIWINGVDVGDLTPAKRTGYYLEPGTYTFELTLKNHLLWSETATLAAKDEWSKTISLVKRANLKIDSDPQRARIWLEGIRLSDLTPSKSKGYFLDPGEHVVKLEKKGYPTYVETLDLTAGEEWDETIPLIPDTWDSLKPRLENHTVSGYWWDFTEEDRRALAELAIKNTLFYQMYKGRRGKANCEGGEGDYGTIVCKQNALIRYLKFGEVVAAADHCYWKQWATSTEEHCYVPDISYNLPCVLVWCLVPKIHFSHVLCAVQVNEDVSKLESWIIFQYSDFDIQVGDWQLPVDQDPGNSSITMIKPQSIDCGSYSWMGNIARWEL